MGKRIATEEKQNALIEEIHNLNQEILHVSEYKNAAQEAAATARENAATATDAKDTAVAAETALVGFLETKETLTAPAVDATLSVSGAAADAKKTGDKIVDLKSGLTAINVSRFVNEINVDDFESGYYSSSDGSKQSAGTYIRVPYLIPIDGGCFYCSDTGSEIQAALFDKTGTFLKRVYFEKRNYEYLDYVPTNAAYVGLYLRTSAPVTSHISLRKYDTSNVLYCEYPFNDKNVVYTEGKWMDGFGHLQSNAGFALLRIVNPNVGDKYYISAQNVYNGLCLDENNTLLTTVSEDVAPFGRIYTVPNGAKQINFNINLTYTKGVNNEPNSYIAKVTKGKVLCIGDSITWLDGRENYGGMRIVTGWQMMLRKAGYDVRSAGFSGFPYATGLDIVDDVDYSIYKEIVTKEYDVSGYDYVIMFGGTNDVLYGGAIGERPTTYSNRVFDASKFNGAVGAIISYIRTNNNDAKILLASFPKSEAASRSYTNARLRVTELEYNADFWSCKYVNIFGDLNVQPTYNQFDDNFYDVTHPNYNGMRKIGTLMLKAVESYE